MWKWRECPSYEDEHVMVEAKSSEEPEEGLRKDGR